MGPIGRSIALAFCAGGLLVPLTARVATGGPMVNQPGELKGKIVGPFDFGQPGEGAGLKAYGL